MFQSSSVAPMNPKIDRTLFLDYFPGRDPKINCFFIFYQHLMVSYLMPFI